MSIIGSFSSFWHFWRLCRWFFEIFFIIFEMPGKFPKKQGIMQSYHPLKIFFKGLLKLKNTSKSHQNLFFTSLKPFLWLDVKVRNVALVNIYSKMKTEQKNIESEESYSHLSTTIDKNRGWVAPRGSTEKISCKTYLKWHIFG